MKKYPKYKDSGVVRIGQIPCHWNKKRIKNIGVMYGGLTGKSGDDFRRDEDDQSNKPFIPFTNICNNTYINRNELKSVSINENDRQNRVQKHDLFFMMTSETQEDVGKTSVLREDLGEVYLNTFCKGFRIKDKEVDPFFLNYLLNGKVYRELISIEGNGYTRINLRQDRVNEFVVILPPIKEQKQIVTYLDHKTTLIEQIISNSQKKIELLKERRTSTINHSVSKGLSSKVKMKDSGVEWIGEIPEGWECRLGTTIGDFFKGKGIKKDEVIDSGVPCIRYGEIYTKYNHRVDSVYSFINEDVSLSSVKVSGPHILLTGSGELSSEIGKAVVVSLDEVFIGGDIIILKPGSDFDPFYLTYLINSECVRVQRELLAKGEIIVHIYSKDFREMRFCCPPLQEQVRISKYLDQKTEEIDSLISSEQRRIEIIKEYRQSLMSEVVTGKIKVTND
jgi:type I restriction enzyme S subunit